MFKDRLIGSIFVLLFTITFVVIGGEVLFFGLLVISLIGMMELYRTLKLNKTSFGILGYVAAIAYYLFIYFNVNNHLFLLILSCVNIFHRKFFSRQFRNLGGVVILLTHV